MSKPKPDPLTLVVRAINRRMMAADALLAAPEKITAAGMVSAKFIRQGLALARADVRRIQRAQRKAKKERTR